MSTNRQDPAAVCTGHYLVVAGGHDGYEALASVELLDTNLQRWSTAAASLPRGIYEASMTVCGDMLYLLGDGTTEVHCCSLQTLLQLEAYQVQAPEDVPATHRDTLWTKVKNLMQPGSAPHSQLWIRLEDLPVRWSTAITVFDQLAHLCREIRWQGYKRCGQCILFRPVDLVVEGDWADAIKTFFNISCHSTRR